MRFGVHGVLDKSFGKDGIARVDLVSAKFRASGCPRGILGQHSLEPEHEPVAHLPARRRCRQPRSDLGECVVECGTPCRPGRECLERILVRGQEGLTEPGLRSASRSSQVL